MNKNIKEWYLNAFPTDDLGCEIKDGITFNDLNVALNNDKDIYDFLGVYDSIVRERVFSELSEVMDVSYNRIYNKWLGIK